MRSVARFISGTVLSAATALSVLAPIAASAAVEPHPDTKALTNINPEAGSVLVQSDLATLQGAAPEALAFLGAALIAFSLLRRRRALLPSRNNPPPR
jgi:hypothetical protein